MNRLTILIGPEREAVFERHYHVADTILIPNLHGSPGQIRETMKRLRASDLSIMISTQCSQVVDAALPEELLLCRTTGLVHMKDEERFMEAYRAGIQHLSEILYTEGLWR
jgi:hypothetical protein